MTSRSATPVRSVEDLGESLRDVLGRLVRKVREETATPTTAQSEVMAHLTRNGPASIAALAQARGVTHQTMRLVVERLEAAGQLARRADPADRRGYLIEATELGHQLATADRQRRAAWLARTIESTLTAKEQNTLDAAVRLLHRLVDPSEQ